MKTLCKSCNSINLVEATQCHGCGKRDKLYDIWVSDSAVRPPESKVNTKSTDTGIYLTSSVEVKLAIEGNDVSVLSLVQWVLDAKKAFEYYQHADGINLKARELLAKFPGKTNE